MLRHLQIRNLAIIESLELDWQPGFTTLTGETGAGKSILIDALGLVIGARADATLVRSGADKAEVSAEFTLEPHSAAAHWLQERELHDDDRCTIRRIVGADGRTRAFVNGTPTTAGDLRSLGERLVEIFGQNESQSLLGADAQRQLLDDYAAHPELLTATREAAAAIGRIDREIEKLSAAQSRDPAQLEFLRFQLQEFDALNLSAEELASLDEEHRRLANGGKLLSEGDAAQQLLYGGDDSIYDRLTKTVTTLSALAPLHAGFGEIEKTAISAQELVRDAADALRHLLEKLDLDPERLAIVERRLESIHDLARKHRARAAELPARHAQLREELATLETAAGGLQTLQAARDEAIERYRQSAAALTRSRTAAAASLQADASARVRELALPNAQFVIAIEPIERERYASTGVDTVRFDFSANPGQAPRPLAKVASGGELSRISLALQVSLRAAEEAAGSGADTMIFDEVDAGIGGPTAEIVGRQLRLLGRRRQVLCVTHLAQVAAQAQTQFGIAKDIIDGNTATRVSTLGSAGRVDELARMLGGADISPATQTLARDLLKRARAD
jgi:DNA repair protein RecN (Recombination protein N)